MSACPPLIPFLNLKSAYLELKPELDEAYARVMSSGWYVLGQEVELFEAAFAEFCGTRHCVGVSNGLDALVLALMAAGIGPGDEVIVPSNTYIATWLAITQVGAQIVPVEPNPVTMNIDAAGVLTAISSRTAAIMPVHLYGQCADMTGIMSVAEQHGLLVIEDAAQCHGGAQYGKRAGSLGHMAAFSFYPGKNLGAYGDAGAVTTNDAAFAEKLRILRNYGSRTKYVNEMVGRNCRLDELQAALLCVKLKHLENWNSRRSVVASEYSRLIHLENVQLPCVLEANTHSWHLYVIRCENRDRLSDKLAENGIQTLIHYPIPPHRQLAYQTLGMKVGSLPISEEIHRTVLSLPIGPDISKADVGYVAEQVMQHAILR